MVKLLVTLAILGGLAFCGATVPLGKKTFFGHVRSIWASDEMKELKDGVKESAGPASEKAKDFVKGGVEAIRKGSEDGSGGSGSSAEPRKDKGD
jgi:hypothetical protein